MGLACCVASQGVDWDDENERAAMLVSKTSALIVWIGLCKNQLVSSPRELHKISLLLGIERVNKKIRVDKTILGIRFDDIS